MKSLKNRYFYTINETLSGQVNGLRYEQYGSDAQGLWASYPIEKQMSEWTELVTNSQNTIAYTFVREYLATKVDDYCFSSANEKLYEGTYLNLDYRIFLSRFMSWWKESFYKYEKLITLYTNNESNLMKGVIGSITNTSSGTDTTTTSAVPTSSTYQSYPSLTDDVADGSQNKSNSTSTITSDNASEDVADHLDKLRDRIINLYNEWLETFVKRFIIYLGE